MKMFNPIYDILHTRYEKGAVLLLTLIVMIALTSVVGAYLDLVRSSTISTGAQITDAQAIYLAKAGLQKAIWNLKTPVGSGGQGENWTIASLTEDFGAGSYTIQVQRWDWALRAHNAVATSPSPAEVGHEADKANDGDDATYWESDEKPQLPHPKDLIIHFPYALTINKVRFIAPASDYTPGNYTWAVSTDGSSDSYTIVATVSNNANIDVTKTFSAQSNVYYLRLRVTKSGHPSSNVRVSTVEAIGSKVTSTGTVDAINRTVEQTAAIDDATQMAYGQIDWDEIE